MEYKIELYELDSLMERYEDEKDIQGFNFDTIDDSRISPKEGDIFIFQSNYEEVRVKIEITEFGYKFLSFNALGNVFAFGRNLTPISLLLFLSMASACPRLIFS